jgi:hypothetical protein
MNDVTIDHKKQAGLTVQTPVTDLEQSLQDISTITLLYQMFKKKTRTSILCQQVTCFR